MESLFIHCTQAFSHNSGMFSVFFLGGLMGGFTHCLTMCGTMVAGQTACAGKCGKMGVSGSQWSYHLGRITSYGALGFLVSLLGKQIKATPYWPTLSAVMLILAGIMFIASSIPQKKHTICHVSAKTNYLRGALMGFMPCGLIYAALMMATTLANPLLGMLAMWLFTIGTIPALLIASISSELLSRKWQHAMQNMGRVMMAFNGLSLLVMATKLVKI